MPSLPPLKRKRNTTIIYPRKQYCKPGPFFKRSNLYNHIFVLLTESDQKIWCEFWIRNSVKTFANVRIRSSKKIDQPKKFRIRMWKFACNKNRKKYKATIAHMLPLPPQKPACLARELSFLYLDGPGHNITTLPGQLGFPIVLIAWKINRYF